MISRRELVTGVIAGVMIMPVLGEAQPPARQYRIGLLIAYPYLPERVVRPVFLPTLRDLGYIEGRNLQIDVRSANYHSERLPALAAELVRLNVDVILTGGESEVRAAKQATSTTPIVMVPSGDPVRAGLIASYARPGGNVTGLSWMSPDLSTKLVQLLKDTLPNASRLAVLWNSTNPVKVIDFEDTRIAAKTLGFDVSSVELKAVSDIDGAFAAIRQTQPHALVILTDETLNYPVYPRLVDFTTHHRLPSIIGESSYAIAGGLIGSGPSRREMWRRAAVYVDKILKGAQPADLPVEQPEVQSGDQPQDRQGPRPHDPAIAAGAGGSDYRMMERRRFLVASLAGALAAPRAAGAQPSGRVARVGMLSVDVASFDDVARVTFLAALKDLGWIQGQDLVFEARYAAGQSDRLPVLAAELVRL